MWVDSKCGPVSPSLAVLAAMSPRGPTESRRGISGRAGHLLCAPHFGPLSLALPTGACDLKSLHLHVTVISLLLPHLCGHTSFRPPAFPSPRPCPSRSLLLACPSWPQHTHGSLKLAPPWVLTRRPPTCSPSQGSLPGPLPPLTVGQVWPHSSPGGRLEGIRRRGDATNLSAPHLPAQQPQTLLGSLCLNLLRPSYPTQPHPPPQSLHLCSTPHLLSLPGLLSSYEVLLPSSLLRAQLRGSGLGWQ